MSSYLLARWRSNKKYPEDKEKINLDGIRSVLDSCNTSQVKRLILSQLVQIRVDARKRNCK